MKSNSDSIYILYLRKDTIGKQFECLIQDMNNTILGIDQLSGGILIGETKIKNSQQNSIPTLIGSDWCPIWLLFHDEDDFNKTKSKVGDYPFGQVLLLQNNNQNYDENDGMRPCPILHIADVKSAKGSVDQAAFLRSYNIMDNSIWNYLIYDIEDKENGELCFDNALESIYENYQKGLYDLAITREYADLNARICKESFLPDIGDGHADGVSPYIFHSEHYVKKQLIKKEFSEIRDTLGQIHNRKWRLLLVDDRAFLPMDKTGERKVESEFPNDSMPWNCKLNIIIRLLKNQFKDDYPGTKIGFRKFDDKMRQIPKDTTILVEYAESLVNAHKALRQRKYDIVLLDYLLKPVENSKKKEYGYQLLEHIYRQILLEEQSRDFLNNKIQMKSPLDDVLKEAKYEELLKLIYFLYKRNYFDKNCINTSDENLYVTLCDIEDEWKDENIDVIRKEIDNISDDKKKQIVNQVSDFLFSLTNENGELAYEENVKIGPKNRLFFMFISAYSSAVHERLLAEGLNQSEKYWHINVGACPTNTPQLFLYNLIKLMEKRLDDSGMSKLSPKGIVDVVEKIYPGSGESPRKYASKYYQEVLSLQYHYKNILDDIDVSARNKSVFETSGSVLMTDFMDNHINLGGLLEHLAQLVHLTAFGTIRQWPEMWEEYIYFKAQLGAQLEKEKDKALVKRFDNLCARIQDYISELKSSSL